MVPARSAGGPVSAWCGTYAVLSRVGLARPGLRQQAWPGQPRMSPEARAARERRSAVVTAADGGGRVSRLRRRRVIVLVITGLAILAAVGELLLTSQIKSPAEQAAQTRAPAATQLTATVQRTVLTRTVLAQGAVGAPKEFTPSQVGGGGTGSGGSAGGQDVQQIVTHVFCRKGSLAGQGSVLLEVAGQPYFVLQGQVPAYRDLAPGETGEDVAQLQQDLLSLGYGTGSDTLGSYGPGTAAAVSAYYEAHGYTAPLVTVG